jgi:cell wall-active antibiotic response 4TMS protein YvqF
MDERDHSKEFAQKLHDQIHQDIHEKINEKMGEKMTRPRVMLVGDSRWGFVLGFIIAALGLGLLLNRIGVLPFDPFQRFWPLLLVVFGVMNLLTQSGRFFGLLLIGAGVVLQLTKLGIIHLGVADLWPLAIIAVGLLVMWGSLESRAVVRGKVIEGFRQKVQQAMDAAYDPQVALNAVAVFGGCERRVTGYFQGGKATAVFGGIELDLRDSIMEADAILEINCIFGGVELRVPDTWNVHSRSMPVFGGYDDKTRQPRVEAGVKPKTLFITGMVVFGGVEIKN